MICLINDVDNEKLYVLEPTVHELKGLLTNDPDGLVRLKRRIEDQKIKPLIHAAGPIGPCRRYFAVRFNSVDMPLEEEPGMEMEDWRQANPRRRYGE